MGWRDHEFTLKGEEISFDPAKFIEGLAGETEADMDAFACIEIVDYREAYYKVRFISINSNYQMLILINQVAQKMFIDNVAIQIIEEQLVETLPNLLSPPSVQNISPLLVSRICAESAADQYRHQELKRVLAILEKSLEACRGFSAGVISESISFIKICEPADVEAIEST